MTYQNIQLRPIAGALGAEIGGVDLSQDLSDAAVAEIRRALLEHLVVFFRDQSITPQQQLAFARRFGEIVRYPLIKGLDDCPDIIPVVKLPQETNNFGGLWHSDMAYTEEPPLGSILCARELPATGGDTIWANMYMAYETLSEGMQALLSGLTGINVSNTAASAQTRVHRIAEAGTGAPVHRAEHPVVRTHPETGRKLLYVNYGHTTCFKGMTEAESKPILETLFAHQVRPEFTCRFQWRPGSIAFWDNRCTQHNPVNDYHGHKRVMHRVTLAGARPV